MRGRLDADIDCLHLDFAGWKVWVNRRPITRYDLASNSHNRLGACAIKRLERFCIDIGHNLRQTIMITQIDKEQPTMVALPVNPAR